jgi:hypothetical protein
MAVNRDKPTTKPITTKPELPAPTFNLADVERIVNEALAKQAEALAAKPPANGKSDSSARNVMATIRAFKKAGFGIVTPNVDVLTFNRWIAQGYRPMEGSKSVKVANLRLFCRQQVRALTAAEKAETQAKADEAVDANKAKIDSAAGRPAKGKGKVVALNAQQEMPL